jgi:hypothetical protein
MDAKLRELAETINLRRAGGFRAAEPIVDRRQRQHSTMDQIRESIRQLAQLETAASCSVGCRARGAHRTNAYTGLIVTVLDVAVLSLLAYLLGRLVADRQRCQRCVARVTRRASTFSGRGARAAQCRDLAHGGDDARARRTVASRELFELIGAYGAG